MDQTSCVSKLRRAQTSVEADGLAVPGGASDPRGEELLLLLLRLHLLLLHSLLSTAMKR